MVVVRERVLDGARAAAFKFSLQRMTVEDISRECGVSRATIYRHFSGGRDQVIADLVADELDRFLGGLTEAVRGLDDVGQMLSIGLASARESVADNELFQRVLAVEPEIVLPHLRAATDYLVGVIGTFLTPFIQKVTSPEKVEAKADYLARLFWSYVTASGSWDLSDPDQVDELIRTQFLAVWPKESQ